MLSLNKFGRGLRWLGEKVTSGASYLGHKIGGALNSIAPAISVVSPEVGAGVAAAGMVAKGVGALGDMGKSVMRGGDINVQAARQTLDGIRSDAGNVRRAYSSVRGPGNPLEKRR